MTTARVARRTPTSVMHDMQRVASQDAIGRAALFVVWLGLAVMSCGVSNLQFTPRMTRRQELI